MALSTNLISLFFVAVEADTFLFLHSLYQVSVNCVEGHRGLSEGSYRVPQ